MFFFKYDKFTLVTSKFLATTTKKQKTEFHILIDWHAMSDYDISASYQILWSLRTNADSPDTIPAVLTAIPRSSYH